ncbi:MAG: hypothetical protein J6V10_08910, partial [Clostridia bacterium]|nr:hypothetical protein [Clostridia bacterium]
DTDENGELLMGSSEGYGTEEDETMLAAEGFSITDENGEYVEEFMGGNPDADYDEENPDVYGDMFGEGAEEEEELLDDDMSGDD